MATLIKLLKIKIVAKSSLGCSTNFRMLCEVLDCSSSKFLNKAGDNEKNATSDPETIAEDKSNTINIAHKATMVTEKPVLEIVNSKRLKIFTNSINSF